MEVFEDLRPPTDCPNTLLCLKGSDWVCSPRNFNDKGFTSSPALICPLHQQAFQNMNWISFAEIHLHSFSVGCGHGEHYLLVSLLFLYLYLIAPAFLFFNLSYLDKTKTRQNPNKQITISCFLHYPSLLSWTALHKTEDCQFVAVLLEVK